MMLYALVRYSLGLKFAPKRLKQPRMLNTIRTRPMMKHMILTPRGLSTMYILTSVRPALACPTACLPACCAAAAAAFRCISAAASEPELRCSPYIWGGACADAAMFPRNLHAHAPA